jgi:RNA polymerase sigma-70 factor (ECF subfamily)
MDDAEAIRLLKGGDISGLEALVRRYQVKAVRTAFLITNDEPLAEDVVQDTFLRIYRRIRTNARGFDETLPFDAYLMRSVVNGSLNAMRGLSRFTSLDEPSDAVNALLARAASVETEIEQEQVRSEILTAVASLPPKQRAVVVQRYYLGMSEREMAQALEAPRGTIKWLLSTARDRLRDLLRPGRSQE